MALQCNISSNKLRPREVSYYGRTLLARSQTTDGGGGGGYRVRCSMRDDGRDLEPYISNLTARKNLAKNPMAENSGHVAG